MTTEFQLLASRVRPIVFGGIPSLLSASWATFYTESFLKLGWFFVFASLTIMAVAAKRNFHSIENTPLHLLVDSPKPALLDILKLSIMPLFTTIAICTSSYLIILMLLSWGIISSVDWLYGPATIFLWLFVYKTINSFFTLYLIDQEGITIFHGLDKVVVPFSKITGVSLARKVKSSLPKLMTTGYTYIPGVRNSNSLVLKLRLKDIIISLWYPEVYLTPTNPNEFQNVLYEISLKG